jgi:hypothetical protein
MHTPPNCYHSFGCIYQWPRWLKIALGANIYRKPMALTTKFWIAWSSWNANYCNPTLRQVWEWNSHSQKWELGVLRDYKKLRVWLQGSKHLTLKCSSCVGKVLKCRCPEWPCMNHLNIYSTSYGRKKSQESNCQFDSQPLKVGNQPDPGICR